MKKLFTLLIIGLITFSSKGQYPDINRPILINNMLHKSFATSVNLFDNNSDGQQLQTGHVRIGSANRQGKSMAIMQRLDSYIYQHYNEVAGEWVNVSRDEFLYDANGNNISDIYSGWDTETATYAAEDKQEFSYNDNGDMISETYATWDIATSQWIYSGNWEYTYNSDGTMAFDIFSMWDETTSLWMLLGKVEFVYNSNRNVVAQNFYFFNLVSNTWMNSSKIENAYNSAGDISLSTHYTWNMINNLWENSSKTEYTYNTGGSLVMEISAQWDNISSQWMNMTKNVYSYDGNGFMTLEIDYQWSTSAMQWINFEKYENTFDGNMNLVTGIYSDWVGGAWTITEKDEYAYNNAYLFNQLILPWGFQDAAVEFRHMLTGITEYYGSSLVLTAKSLFNYSMVGTTGIVESAVNQATIFPQPSTGLVTFSWENKNKFFDLMLYDVNQRIVLNRQIENNGIVSLAGLASGIYFYKLTGNGNTMCAGKLSVR